MKQTWKQRNEQRTTVKKPGTSAYKAAAKNFYNQFYNNGAYKVCKKCGSDNVVIIGGFGKMIIYCSKCNNVIARYNTSHVRVGNWSKTRIDRLRAGLCEVCGNGKFIGKMHRNANGNKYVIKKQCTCCSHKETICIA